MKKPTICKVITVVAFILFSPVIVLGILLSLTTNFFVCGCVVADMLAEDVVDGIEE